MINVVNNYISVGTFNGLVGINQRVLNGKRVHQVCPAALGYFDIKVGPVRLTLLYDIVRWTRLTKRSQ